MSNPKVLVVWGKALYEGKALEDAGYLQDLLDAVPVGTDSNAAHCGLAVGIRRDGPLGTSYGHGGWIPGYCSSLRYYPEYGVAVAFQVNTDIGLTGEGGAKIEEIERLLAQVAVSAT